LSDGTRTELDAETPAQGHEGRGRAWRFWLPPIFWMALIFAFSSVSIPLPAPAPDYVFVLAHFAEFFILAGLLLRALNRGFGRSPSLAASLTGFTLSVIYAITDELHQSFVPGRVPDFGDIAVDAAGAAAAILLITLLLLAIHRPKRG